MDTLGDLIKNAGRGEIGVRGVDRDGLVETLGDRTLAACELLTHSLTPTPTVCFLIAPAPTLVLAVGPLLVYLDSHSKLLFFFAA